MKKGFLGPKIGDWVKSIVDPTKMTEVDIGEQSENEAAVLRNYSMKGQDILTASASDVGEGMGSQTYQISGIRLLHEIRSLNVEGKLYPPDLWLPLAQVIWQLHSTLEQ